MINFNEPPVVGSEINYITEAINNKKISGDGIFTHRCSEWMQKNFQAKKALITTSCTHALEMCAYLLKIEPGDEIIMPSFTFVSTANAFVIRGAKIVFVDVRPDTMNIDEKQIEGAISKRTKAIVPVHYAGVACEMDEISKIAKAYHLKIIEDAAQGVNAFYKNKALGTIGDLGCYSFHETKNYSMGEGGALLVNDNQYIESAEIIREKGTNRNKFFRGEIDKYTWVDQGSSYLPSEINAAYLYAQLLSAEVIYEDRMKNWNLYHKALNKLEELEIIKRPVIPNGCIHNAHIYAIRVKDIEERTKLINYLKSKEILSVFHYVPLHTSSAGRKWGEFRGVDRFTTKESERLLRLPLYFGLKQTDLDYIVSCIYNFYGVGM